MYPRVFGFSSYFTAWAIAIVLGVTILVRNARREGIPLAQAVPIILSLTVLLIIGAKLLSVLQQTLVGPPPIGLKSAPAASVWHRGFQTPGGLALAMLGLPLVCSLVGAPTGRVGDAFFPGVWAALAVARTGCLLHGCCYGIRSDLPWAIQFPPASPAFAWHFHSRWITDSAPASLPVQPLQIYYVALCVAVYLLSRWLWRTRRVIGFAWMLSAACFFAGSFALEWLRQERIEVNLALNGTAAVTLFLLTFVLTRPAAVR